MKFGMPIFAALAALAVLCAWRTALSGESGGDRAAAEAAVRKADAARAAAAGSADVDAWAAFYAPDAVVLLPDDLPASGRQLVRESVARLLAQPRISVAWHPIKVQIARSADLADVIGAYELRFGDSHGASTVEQGKVHELWRMQADGTWKCIVDTWNSDGPTAAQPPALSQAPELSQAPAPSQAPVPPQTAASVPGAAAPAKYGDMPVKYKEAIQQFFNDHLKAPDSIRYRELTEPEKGYTAAVSGSILMRETREYGWTVKATISAKANGRYTGFKTYAFLFRGEKIVHILMPVAEDEMK